LTVIVTKLIELSATDIQFSVSENTVIPRLLEHSEIFEGGRGREDREGELDDIGAGEGSDSCGVAEKLMS